MRKQTSFAFALTLLATPAFAAGVQLTDAQLSEITAGNGFTISHQIADLSGTHTTDPSLVNPWGLANAPGGPLWVADNGPGLATVYNFNTFKKMGLTVTIPGGNPTGEAFNPSDEKVDFNVSENGKSGQSVFLFVTETGNIDGWAPSVDPNNAIVAVSQPNSVFKGLALVDPTASSSMDNGDGVIFATDFHNNSVDEFSSTFKLMRSFTDTTLPAGFAPFNVVDLNGLIYVSFAEQKPDKHDEVDGPGLGYVDIFNTQGHLVRRLVSQGALNAPWGMMIAPSDFGQFAGQLLVGNFGDGKINVYNPTTGAFDGTLTTANGSPARASGLWALIAGPNGTVTFSSGPDGENHGLVGTIGPSTAASMVSVAMHSKGTAMTGLSVMGH